MIWPEEIRWQPYTVSSKRQAWLPVLTVKLGPPGRQAPRLFLVDTGATLSVAPLFWSLDLLDRNKPKPDKRDSGLKDAQGNPVIGIPLTVDLELVFDSAPPLRLQETIWFCEKIIHGLLGQSTFLEQMGALFLNFPSASEDRRFGLFRREESLPPAGPPSSGPQQ